MILTFLFWKSVAHFLTFIFSVAYQVIFSRLGTTFQDFNLFLRKSINPVFNKHNFEITHFKQKEK